MKNSKIKTIKAVEILDSRGNPTVEAEVETDSGAFAASVPSGASTGKYEAVELRDGGKRYGGKGVLRAVENVNKIIAPKLKGKDALKQKEIDEFLIKLDGTENKSKLGANALCAVSAAVCRAGAVSKSFPLYQYVGQLAENSSSLKLPTPCFNVINGGAHAGSDLDIQEFMLAPWFDSFAENFQTVSEIYHILKEILQEKFGKTAINIGDEGGFAPQIKTSEQAIDLLLEAIKNSGNGNDNFKIVLDCAASQFYSDEKYKTKMGIFTPETMSDYYFDLVKTYPILLGFEDPFAEDDWRGWQKMMSNVKCQMSNALIIGDDLLVTNPKRMKKAKEKNACNGAIIKINQIGTISEAIEAVRLAKSYGWKIMVANRSGETNDDFISDFAVGVGADFIKAGAPARGERVAKYNRLLKIEKEIIKQQVYSRK